MYPAHIFPSLIAAPKLLQLYSLIQDFDPICAGYHIDIMDYHFVPNLTWGPMFANAIRQASEQQMWIDLLVEHPEQYLDDLKLASGDSVTVHVESTHERNIISQIQNAGYFAGIGINPDTPLEHLTPYLHIVDHVLLMSVHPGFSGQEFIPESQERLATLVSWRTRNDDTYAIAMDGGIDMHNIAQLYHTGAEMFSIGSGIFEHTSPQKQLKKLIDLTSA